MCVRVCVFFPFILDIKFGGRTSRGHTGFLIHLPSAVLALIFVATRIQQFLSLVDREVELCVLTIKSFSTCWASNSRPNVSEGYEVTSELPGRPAWDRRVFIAYVTVYYYYDV